MLFLTEDNDFAGKEQVSDHTMENICLLCFNSHLDF
jgi:hypothetical protein